MERLLSQETGFGRFFLKPFKTTEDLAKLFKELEEELQKKFELRIEFWRSVPTVNEDMKATRLDINTAPIPKPRSKKKTSRAEKPVSPKRSKGVPLKV